MRDYLHTQFRDLRRNLRAGLRLAFFRPTRRADFSVTLDQAVWLVLFALALDLFVTYLRALPMPSFNRFAFTTEAIAVVGVLFTGYIIGQWLRRQGFALAFFVLAYSVAPALYVSWTLLELGWDAWSGGTNAYWAIYGLYFVWFLAVTIVVLQRLGTTGGRPALVQLGVYLLAAWFPAYTLHAGPFWYPDIDDDERQSRYADINQEDLYYAQPGFLADVERGLRRGRKGTVDLYFVGFAGDASQDVFMKEVRFAQALFDARFDTAGRSVALINNPATAAYVPLASANNLALTLKQVGRAMNNEEDVLFLFLTSHGSRKHELSVQFWPLRLNMISPEDLKEALDEAGIKWRVLMISACYSGGFLDALKDEHTLIATAAAPDRQSFGCSNESEFTYFGKAVLDHALPREPFFPAAFTEAVSAIEARETAEGLQPSRPQLFIGTAIEQKLRALARRLRGLGQPQQTAAVQQ